MTYWLGRAMDMVKVAKLENTGVGRQLRLAIAGMNTRREEANKYEQAITEIIAGTIPEETWGKKRGDTARNSVVHLPGNEWEIPLLGSEIKWVGNGNSGDSHF